MFDEKDSLKLNNRADKNRKLEDMRADIAHGMPREVQSLQSLKTFVNEQIDQNNTRQKSGDQN